jgi:uncharacterized protein (TIGR03067 family)
MPMQLDKPIATAMSGFGRRDRPVEKGRFAMRFLAGVRLFVLGAMVSLLAVRTGFADNAADQEKFQGVWQRVSIVDDGKKVEGAETGSVVFSGSEYTLKDGNTVKSKGTYKLDASKTPKELDVMPGAGPNKGKTLKAIYKFDGDQLIYCIAGPDLDRPKEFASPAGMKLRLYVNKRVK